MGLLPLWPPGYPLEINMRLLPAFTFLALCAVLPGCEQLAELDGSRAVEAEGKATGGACRHAGRALEDCYALNEKAPRAAVFAGWREMNDYMTQNKIDPVVPVEPPPKKAAAKQDEVVAGKPALPPADAARSVLAGKAAVAARAGGVHDGGARGGERGAVQPVDVQRGPMTPQETAAALFAPPDAAAAAAQLPAKVLAGKTPEKAAH